MIKIRNNKYTFTRDDIFVLDEFGNRGEWHKYSYHDLSSQPSLPILPRPRGKLSKTLYVSLRLASEVRGMVRMRGEINMTYGWVVVVSPSMIPYFATSDWEDKYMRRNFGLSIPPLFQDGPPPVESVYIYKYDATKEGWLCRGILHHDEGCREEILQNGRRTKS